MRNSPKTLLSRPDWFSGDNNDMRLPLHNNVCIDSSLQQKTQDLLQLFDARELYSYAEQYNIYKIISDYHEVPIKNISIGLGATEIINRLIYLAKDERVVIVSPTFEMVEVYCKMYSVDYINKNYIDFNIFNIDQIPSGCVVYIANPNGNNGHTFNRGEIINLIKKSKQVLLDESYIDYSIKPSFLESIDKYSNLVIINTLSKSLGLAGIRCGYCFSTTETIKLIQNIRMNYVATGMTEYLVKNLIYEIQGTVDRMIDAREYLEQKFDSIPSAGNYCLLRGCQEKFSFCKYKNVGDDIIRVTLADKEIFVNEIS